MQEYRMGGYSMLPTVVKNLIIINVLFYIGTFSLGGFLQIDLTDLLGLHYFGSEKFFPFQFITYMFMHSTSDIFHIFFNMFALWMFGSSLENVWGPKKFLLFYFVTGIGAAIVHYSVFYFQVTPVLQVIDSFLDHPTQAAFQNFINSDYLIRTEDVVNLYNTELLPKLSASTSNSAQIQLMVDFMSQYRVLFLNQPVVVGASGAVFGLLLGFGMLFPNSLIYVFFAIPVRAKYFVIIYGAIELFSGVRNSATDNVAHFAHLGGMIFGFLLILYWKKKGTFYSH